MATVSYTRMADMTDGDMRLLEVDADLDANGLPGRLLDAVAALENFQGSLNARDRYRGHPYYDDCVEFCEHFDQNCFDPDYDSLPLEFFRPIVEEVFSRPRFAAD